MAGVSTEQGSNKLDVELNLVPFIDLLSTLVLFLLITAVWIQVSVIPASVDSKGKSTVAVAEQAKLLVHLTDGGIRLTWPAGLGVGMPVTLGKTKKGYDLDKLGAVLQKLTKTPRFPMVAVSADDGVYYGWVVEAIDAVKAAGGKNVALSTN